MQLNAFCCNLLIIKRLWRQGPPKSLIVSYIQKARLPER